MKSNKSIQEKIYLVGCPPCRMRTAPLPTNMTHSFKSWGNDLTPEADKIVPLVAAAGASGMSRKQLGSAVELDRDVLDELLAGLVRLRILSLASEHGIPVYRAGIRIG